MPGNSEPRRVSSSAASALSLAENGSPSAVPPYWSFSSTSSSSSSNQRNSSMHLRPPGILPFGLDRQPSTSSGAVSRDLDGAAADGSDAGSASAAGMDLDLAVFDPAKPPVSGANAVPLSPRSRYGRGLRLEDEEEPQMHLAESSHPATERAKAVPSVSLSCSPTGYHPLDYVRPSTWLRPGAIFTGKQSFTSYIPPAAAPNAASYYRNSGSLLPLADRRPSPYPSHATHQANSRQFPSWTDLSGSAVDPAMTSFLSSNGSFGYASGSSVNRSRARQLTPEKEEWEVQVCICGVDWENGRVEGVMKALNVPNNPSSSAALAASMGVEPSLEKTRPHSTVTTSFSGEVVDLHNYTIWTRPTPLSSAASRGQPASTSDTVWLSPYQTVDKTTDLEYWSKTEAFQSYGPGAEKEICRIAREGTWHKDGSRRRDVGDWVLMRWKERDFIDCDASTSGLTISGFYYVCLNRKSGALSGFYYDPSSTPHQRLELTPACSAGPLPSVPSGNNTSTRHWFASYSAL